MSRHTQKALNATTNISSQHETSPRNEAFPQHETFPHDGASPRNEAFPHNETFPRDGAFPRNETFLRDCPFPTKTSSQAEVLPPISCPFRDSDALVILEAGPRLLLSKTFQKHPDGTATASDYGNAKHFSLSAERFHNIDQLHRILQNLSKQRHKGVIRGFKRPETPIHRSVRSFRDKPHEKATFEEGERRWLMIDVDGWETSFDVDPSRSRDLKRAARELVDSLPIQQADCVFKWSSTAFLNKGDLGVAPRKAKAHVWVLLEEAVCDESFKAWLKHHQLDASIANPVQLHYTAHPAFRGMQDPLAWRIWSIRGAQRRVNGSLCQPPLYGLEEARRREEERKKHKTLEESRRNKERERKRKKAKTWGFREKERGITARKWAQEQLRNACEEIECASLGSRHNTIRGKAFWMGRVVGGNNQLSQEEALGELLDAARRSLGQERGGIREAERTVMDLFSAGLREPCSFEPYEYFSPGEETLPKQVEEAPPKQAMREETPPEQEEKESHLARYARLSLQKQTRLQTHREKLWGASPYEKEHPLHPRNKDRFLPPIPKREGMEAIRASLGTGKTEQAKRLCQQYGTILWISHRVALTRNTCERLNAHKEKEEAEATTKEAETTILPSPNEGFEETKRLEQSGRADTWVSPNTWVSQDEGQRKQDEGQRKPRPAPILFRGHSKPQETESPEQQQQQQQHQEVVVGFELYLDIQGELRGEQVVVCIDSIRRVERAYEAIVVDEADQVLQSLIKRGGKRDHQDTILLRVTRLSALLKKAKQVLLLSADMDSWTAEAFAKMGGLEPEQVRWTHHKWVHPGESWRFFEHGTMWREAVKQEWLEGKRLAIFCASRQELKKKALWLKGLRPEAKVLSIHSEAEDEERNTLCNVNEEWKKVDAVLFTTSAGAGVSFDVREHFDRVCISGVHAPRDLMASEFPQGGARPRHPKSREIWAYIPKGGRYPKTREEIQEDFNDRERKTIEKMLALREERLEENNEEGDIQWSWQESIATYVYLHARAQREERSAHRLLWLLRTLLQREIPIIHDTREPGKRELKETRKELREAKQKREEEKLQRIAGARCLTPKEAKELQGAEIQKEEQLALEKHEIASFYADTFEREELAKRAGLAVPAPPNPSVDLLRLDRGGTTRRELRKLVLAVGYRVNPHHFAELDLQDTIEDPDNEEELKAFGDGLMEKGRQVRSKVDARHHAEYAEGLSDMLCVIEAAHPEIRRVLFGEEAPAPPSLEEAIDTFLSKGKKRLSLMRIRGLHAEGKPQKIVGDLARVFGLKRKSCQRRTGGENDERERVYSMDTYALFRTMRLIRPEWARMERNMGLPPSLSSKEINDELREFFAGEGRDGWTAQKDRQLDGREAKGGTEQNISFSGSKGGGNGGGTSGSIFEKRTPAGGAERGEEESHDSLEGVRDNAVTGKEQKETQRLRLPVCDTPLAPPLLSLKNTQRISLQRKIESG